MTPSRKLCVAALFLAGGYVAAFFVGGLTDWIATQSDIPTARDLGPGVLTRMHGTFDRRGDVTTAGQLVPDTRSAPRSDPTTPNAAPTPNDSPTWLAATSGPTDPAPIAGRLTSTANTLAERDRPISAAFDQEAVLSSDAHAAPRARITNVRAATAEAPFRDASPWDRWPPWDAGAAATGGSAAADMTNTASATKTGDVPTTFSQLEVVRRNSPARDGGSQLIGGRTHIVVDGDSLDRLAERYLDNARLGDEIYRLNRDVLTGPDVLPIGVELKIPDRLPAGPSADERATAGLAAVASPGGMVPVEWSPKARDGTPQAELLRPVPTGRPN